MQMHKSRLGTIVIDCQTEDIEASAGFWSRAFGWPAVPLTDPQDANYRKLTPPADEVAVLVQAVSHPSRVHVDIETDDVDAEVRRLEALGAKRIAAVKRWWVMEAPTGQRFCVVRPQRSDFAARATPWNDDGTPADGAAPARSSAAPDDAFSPTLRTERLRLRPLVEDDAAALFDIFSDARVVRYLSRPLWTRLESARERIAQDAAAGAARRYLRLGVEVAASGRMVGECSLFNIHVDSRRAEIGYALAFDAWGRGYITEALAAVLDHAFSGLGLNRVEADIDPRNGASERVLQRLGFREEGRLRERWFVAGEMSDSALHGLLAHDWRQARERAPAG
jgi:RimJ/RimL family protein N-acetyltransferase/predicted enzyme related to lactoylglutathione lyase